MFNYKKVMVIVILVLSIIVGNMVLAKDNFKSEEEENLYEKEGNTGDLRLEDGAVMWPETTPEQRLHLEEQNKRIKKMLSDLNFEKLMDSTRYRKIIDFKTKKIKNNMKKPYSTKGVRYYRPDDYYENSLNIPLYTQTKYYYCAVATVKELDNYYNNINYSQDYYARYLGTTSQGTDFSKVASYLANYVKSGYILTSIGSYNEWYSRVIDSIDSDMPAVLDINTTDIRSFEYDSRGHILCVSGYRLGREYGAWIRVNDSHPHYSGLKWIPANQLYNANNNHFRRQMIR